jgi:hypothetical protein
LRCVTGMTMAVAVMGQGLLSLPLLAGAVAGKSGKGAESLLLEEGHPMYLGTLSFGVKTSDVYTDGHVSVLAPVWSSLGADGTLGGGVLFLEPYTSLGEQGEVASSLGVGWRYLSNDQPVAKIADKGRAGFLTEGWYVGANVFVDLLDTQFDNQFWQLGFGAEVGTRYLGLRGNYYLPLSDRQYADSFRTREIRQTSSTSVSQSTAGSGDPFATGHTVQQDAVFTTLATTTTRTTTIDRLFHLYEEGMEGWDVEAALLLPGLDEYVEVKLIGGYYQFDNQPFGPQAGGTGNVEGFKAGLELRPVPALVLSGTWYEDDRLTGSDWTVGVQLQIPLGKEWKDAFVPRRRHLVERMAEPVARQNAAVKVAKDVELEKTSTSTKVKRVTKVVAQSRQRLVLAEDIVFVNNGDSVGNGIQAGSAVGDGTAEAPLDTIAAAALLAGDNSTTSGRVWNVYTQHTATPYAEEVTVLGSVNFISSKTPIAGVGGKNFGGNTARPVVMGGFEALNVPYLGITAYDIRQGMAIGDLNGDLVGVRVFSDGSASTVATLRDNRINSDYHGVHVQAQGGSAGVPGATLQLVVEQQNAIHGSEYGIELRTEGYGVLEANLSHNLSISGGDRGVNAYSTGGTVTDRGSQLKLNIVGNAEISAESGGAIVLEAAETSNLTALVQGNASIIGDTAGISARSGYGSGEFERGGKLVLDVIGNQLIRGDFYDGIDLFNDEFGDMEVFISQNAEISGKRHGVLATDSGATSSTERSGYTEVRIHENGVIRGDDEMGVYLSTYGQASMFVDMYANPIIEGGITGIAVFTSGGDDAVRGSMMEVYARNNERITGVESGVFLEGAGYSDLTVILDQNGEISGLTAIEAEASGGSDTARGTKLDLQVSNSRVIAENGTGIFLQALEYSNFEAAVLNNLSIHAANEAIYVQANGGSSGTDRGAGLNLDIVGNASITSALATAINIHGYSYGDADVLIWDNGTIVGSDKGVNVVNFGENSDQTDGPIIHVVIGDNDLIQGGSVGIDLSGQNGSQTYLELSNQVVAGGEYGLWSRAEGEAFMGLTLDGNTFTGTTVAAIRLDGKVLSETQVEMFDNTLNSNAVGLQVNIDSVGAILQFQNSTGNVVNPPAVPYQQINLAPTGSVQLNGVTYP